jgi:hypothetical protein
MVKSSNKAGKFYDGRAEKPAINHTICCVLEAALAAYLGVFARQPNWATGEGNAVSADMPR